MKLNTFYTGMLRLYMQQKILLIMKMIIIILTTCLLQVSASTFGQNITLSESNASLELVLKKIKVQSKMNILFSDKIFDQAKKVNIKLANVPLKEALDRLLENQPLSYELSENTIIISKREPSLLDKARLVIQNIAKDLTVKGRVVDNEGKPLPNASIRVKGKNAVTNTNQNGEFEIKGVDEDAVLLVSYVGFKTLEIAVKDAVMPLEIKLNVATGELEEVKVVYNTGYQELNKERSTGSFVQIDNGLFNRAVGTNVLDRILNVTSGLINNAAPGADGGGIIIRGYSTINAGKRPLIVVDNFPYEGNLNNLNPNDIESITVLRDAAAASIWGVRAGNGVIVINTKKGNYNQSINIELKTDITLNQKPDLFYIPYVSSEDIIDFEKLQFGKGVYNDYDDLYPSIGAFPVLPQAVEILLAARNRNKNVLGYNALNDPNINM